MQALPLRYLAQRVENVPATETNRLSDFRGVRLVPFDVHDGSPNERLTQLRGKDRTTVASAEMEVHCRMAGATPEHRHQGRQYNEWHTAPEYPEPPRSLCMARLRVVVFKPSGVVHF